MTIFETASKHALIQKDFQQYLSTFFHFIAKLTLAFKCTNIIIFCGILFRLDFNLLLISLFFIIIISAIGKFRASFFPHLVLYLWLLVIVVFMMYTSLLPSNILFNLAILNYIIQYTRYNVTQIIHTFDVLRSIFERNSMHWWRWWRLLRKSICAVQRTNSKHIQVLQNNHNKIYKNKTKSSTDTQIATVWWWRWWS